MRLLQFPGFHFNLCSFICRVCRRPTSAFTCKSLWRDVGSNRGGLTVKKSCVDQRRMPNLGVRLWWLLLTAAAGTADTVAESDCARLAGQLVSAENSVQIQSLEGSSWDTGVVGQHLCEGDTIRVGSNSRAALQLVNEAIMRLGSNTTMRLLNVSADTEERSFLEVLSGQIKTFIRKPRRLTVNTPYLNGLIEGTEFQVSVDEKSSAILLLEGQILAANDQGEVRIMPGEKAISDGGAPQKVLVLNPRDAVQWTVHVPTLADPGGYPEGSPLSLASKQLAVGNLDGASASLRQALQQDSGSADAYAMESILWLARDDKVAASKAANNAVNTNPDSASAWLAKSYTQQASGDLQAAAVSARKATDVAPDNAYAWARRSELQSAAGEYKESLGSAQKAVGLNPGVSRSHTVLGFAYLTNMELDEAEASFTEAMTQDQSDPLPHLGLGLAKIGQGDLPQGRAEIDVAVGLDPNQSVLRSYLGKAYYEERRSPLDEQQYAIAKDLDPNDPTPWFYEAIALQTSNRPVEALHSIEQATELNDNRSVYRSSLLLDSDAAARTASVGRIYSDLGFQELALREGWKSVATDPTDFSGHRLLADSYSALPRHEIARVSELLQSQLLQPVNMTPIQPRLAESNLALISAGGPGSLSFNEFNPMFNRQGLVAQITPMAGANGTTGGEAVLAGLGGNTSFSLGLFHYETDGFRDNADQADDIANLFVQHDFSPSFSVQGEYRYRSREYGDLLMRFFSDNYYPTVRYEEESDTARLGFKYDFSPASLILGSLIYQKDRLDLTDPDFPLAVSPSDLGLPDPLPAGFQLETQAQLDFSRPDQESTSAEFQYLYRAEKFNVLSGAGYFEIDGNLQQSGSALFTLQLPFPPFQAPLGGTAFSSSDDYMTRHTNAYSYGNFEFLSMVDVTLGVSYDKVSDSLQGGDLEKSNYKFGLRWEPWAGTTFRVASFEVVKRTLATSQTLEPTQVAGFNQFYDDINLTESRKNGVAIDYEVTSDISLGVEYSERELDVPYISGVQDFNKTRWEESVSSMYVFWMPWREFSLSLKYEYEELEREDDFPEGVIWSDTQKVPLLASYFFQSGFSISLQGTWYDQEGEFGGGDFGEELAGEDSFLVMDMYLSYRFPSRRGVITVGVNNFLDEDFNYFDQDLNNASVQPDRFCFVRLTLAIP